MKNYYIDKDNKKYDLKNMTFDELKILNYQEECYYASQIKKLPAFSQKRSEYSKMAYEKIFEIADAKKVKNPNYGKKVANGSTDASVELLSNLIKQKQKRIRK